MSEQTPDDCASEAEAQDVSLARAAMLQRDHPVVRALGAASEVADQPPMIAICCATLAAGLLTRRPSLVRAGARMLASHLLATGIKSLVKKRINRTRPALLEDEGRYETGGEGVDEGDRNSFPSGHTAGVVAVAGGLSQEYERARAPAYGIAAAIAALQVPRGAHYPADVAAGWAIGWAAQRLVRAGIGLAKRRPF